MCNTFFRITQDDSSDYPDIKSVNDGTRARASCKIAAAQLCPSAENLDDSREQERQRKIPYEITRKARSLRNNYA